MDLILSSSSNEEVDVIENTAPNEVDKRTLTVSGDIEYINSELKLSYGKMVTLTRPGFAVIAMPKPGLNPNLR